jgi:hypothetical protein
MEKVVKFATAAIGKEGPQHARAARFGANSSDTVLDLSQGWSPVGGEIPTDHEGGGNEDSHREQVFVVAAVRFTL